MAQSPDVTQSRPSKGMKFIGLSSFIHESKTWLPRLYQFSLLTAPFPSIFPHPTLSGFTFKSRYICRIIGSWIPKVDIYLEGVIIYHNADLTSWKFPSWWVGVMSCLLADRDTYTNAWIHALVNEFPHVQDTPKLIRELAKVHFLIQFVYSGSHSHSYISWRRCHSIHWLLPMKQRMDMR